MGLFSKTVKPVIRRIQNQFDEPALVLLYHRVEDLEHDYQQLAVSPFHFNEQVSYLKQHYQLISVDEFTELKKNKQKFPPRSVLLTFDDGYADNKIHAMPILEAHRAQAIFYITTSKLGTDQLLWWDLLEQIFAKELPSSLKLTVKHKEYVFDEVNKHKREVLNTLHPLIKYNTIAERESLLGELVLWSGADVKADEKNRLMNTDELREMASSSACVIGAHTLDHPVLSELSATEQHEQIEGSKLFLEQLLNKKINHFSYPFGGHKDYNRQTVEVCRNIGFDMVTSNFPWQVHSYTSRFEVPRYLVRNWDIDTFADRIKRFFTS